MRDLIKDMAKYSPALIFPALVGLVEVPILTRFFLPEQYGQYSIVITTVMALIIGIGWLTMSVVRFYPLCEAEGTLGSLYGSVLLALLLWILVIAGVFIATISILDLGLGAYQYRLMLVGCGLFFSLALFQTSQSFLRATRRIGWYSSFATWQHLGRFAFGMLFVMGLGFGIEGWLWGYVIAVATGCPVILFIVLRRHVSRMSVSPVLIGRLARYGFPLLVCILMEWVLSLSNLYFIGYFHGEEELGIYSASQNLSAKSMFLLTALFQVAARPLEIRVWELEGAKKSMEYTTNLTRYFLLACLPFGMILLVLAKPLVFMLTAEKYHQGFQIIPFIVVGSFMLGLEQRFQVGLLFHMKTNIIMLCFLAAGLLSVGLNFLLIPGYGLLGAAIAFMISYGALLVVMIIASRRYYSWSFPFITLLKASTALAVMGASMYYLNAFLAGAGLLNMALCSFVGIIVYTVVLLVLREFHANELKALKNLLAKRK